MTDSKHPPEPPTDGQGRKLDDLLPEVYDELRHLALRQMSRERPDHTLQATALTHEAYIRLLAQEKVAYREGSHLMAIAAQAMRRILVDHARGKGRVKRGGDLVRVTVQDLDQLQANTSASVPEIDLIELDQALLTLAEEEPRKAKVVEMRYIGGMSTDEIASVLEVTPRTVERDWKFARAWLTREIKKQSSSE